MGAMMALGALSYALVLQLHAEYWSFSSFIVPKETLLAFWLLVSGGFLVAFDLPLKIREMLRGLCNAVVASFFLLISLILLKYIYQSSGFISGFVWSRLGLFLGGLSLLVMPVFRKEIIESLQGMSQSKQEQRSVGIWFVANKIVGALGNLCIQYALFLGSLVVIQALSGLQFAFVFLLALPFSYRFPELFREKLYFNDWLQKIIALALIGLGIYFSVMSGAKLFLL
jgi:hypothetical protein